MENLHRGHLAPALPQVLHHATLEVPMLRRTRRRQWRWQPGGKGEQKKGRHSLCRACVKECPALGAISERARGANQEKPSEKHPSFASRKDSAKQVIRAAFVFPHQEQKELASLLTTGFAGQSKAQTASVGTVELSTRLQTPNCCLLADDGNRRRCHSIGYSSEMREAA